MKYLQFPLFLLRDLLTNKEQVLNQIIRYGIYRFAQSMQYDIREVARQLMYGYYRGYLTNNLFKTLEYYILNGSIEIDDDYNGFAGDKFIPDDSIENILKLFTTDRMFRDVAIEYYQIKQAYKFLNITGNYDNCKSEGQKIAEMIPEKEPMPMVSKSLVFEFRDHSKTEFDLMQFACYIGINSILGKKNYSRTNKQMILCRAFGYASIKHLPEDISELYKKYSKRYHIDKLITFLELNWGVITYSNNMRGMYISKADKMPLNSLVLAAETKKHSRQINELKNKKNEAKKRAIEQLNKGQPLNKVS